MAWRNIFDLSKIFIVENALNFDLIKGKKLNKKSSMFWLVVILFIAISWLSQEIMKVLVRTSKPEIFLNVYFLFLGCFLIVQSIILYMNIFYFSKDIENVLPLPFKPLEILISKLNTLLIMLYTTEAIFALVPILIYGIYAAYGISFYINFIIVLLLFPIFPAVIIGIIEMLLINFTKIFKNKDFMQMLISGVLIILLALFVGYFIKGIFDLTTEELENTIENIQENPQLQVEKFNNLNEKVADINKKFLFIHQSSEILQGHNILINYCKLIIINVIAILTFSFLGNKLYLKQLLANSAYIKDKKAKDIIIEKSIKKSSPSKSYIKKEFKMILKNPALALQCVYTNFLIAIIVLAMLSSLATQVRTVFKDEAFIAEYGEEISNLKFDFPSFIVIAGVVQILGLFNYSSITSISREGINAKINKYIPIDFYDQFIFKNVPQIVINTGLSILLLAGIHVIIPEIELKYIFNAFIVSLIITITNSFILCLINCMNPRTNWVAEYEILKKNKNKLLQYVLIVFNISYLYYFSKLLGDMDVDGAIIILEIILSTILIAFNFIIYYFKNKLFKKIN